MARVNPVNTGYTIINGVSSGINAKYVDTWVEWKLTGNSLNVKFYSAWNTTSKSSSTAGNKTATANIWINGNKQAFTGKSYDYSSLTPNEIFNHTTTLPSTDSFTIRADYTTPSTYISGGTIAQQTVVPSAKEISQLIVVNNQTNTTETYLFKDPVARQKFSGFATVIAYSGGTPVSANIPAGVKVVYNGTTYTGTLAATVNTNGNIYLIKDTREEDSDIYNEYVTILKSGTYSWEKFGIQKLDLSDIKVVWKNRGTDPSAYTSVKVYTSDADIAFSGTSYLNALTSATLSYTNPSVAITPSYSNITLGAGAFSVSAGTTGQAIKSLGTLTSASAYTSVTGNVSKLSSSEIIGVSSTTQLNNISTNAAITASTLKSAGSAATSAVFSAHVSGENLYFEWTPNTALVMPQFNLDGATFNNTVISSTKVTTPLPNSSKTTVANGTLTSGTAGIVVSIASSQSSFYTSIGTPTKTTLVKSLATGTAPAVSFSTVSSGGVKVADGITSVTPSGGSVTLASYTTVAAISTFGTATISDAPKVNNSTSGTIKVIKDTAYMSLER